MAEKRCNLCNGKIKEGYQKRYAILKAGDKVMHIACLFQLIEEKKWKVKEPGKEANKDKLKPKHKLINAR